MSASGLPALSAAVTEMFDAACVCNAVLRRSEEPCRRARSGVPNAEQPSAATAVPVVLVPPPPPPPPEAPSFKVIALSPGFSSGSTRLVTVAVASSSPAFVTVPQIVTFVPVPGAIQATSQVKSGADPVHPLPRSEYVFVTAYPSGRTRSSRTAEAEPSFLTETWAI
jgi:hypothetical protein